MQYMSREVLINNILEDRDDIAKQIRKIKRLLKKNRIEELEHVIDRIITRAVSMKAYVKRLKKG